MPNQTLVCMTTWFFAKSSLLCVAVLLSPIRNRKKQIAHSP
jgi:hypothetical protein